MGNLLFQTKSSIDGPWLLDETSLMKLDSIIIKHWDKLEERRKGLLENAVEAEYQKYSENYKGSDIPYEVQNRLNDLENIIKITRKAIRESRFLLTMTHHLFVIHLKVQ